MAHFQFITCWRFRSPLEPVWACIDDYERWPSWWKGVEEVTILRRGGAGGIGTQTRQVWKSALPYRLRFDIEITRVVPLELIEVAADGELRGTGTMGFSTNRDEVTVRFDWRVETTEAWMNAVAPIARPVFAWNHGVIMNWGAECLAKHLEIQLLDSGNC